MNHQRPDRREQERDQEGWEEGAVGEIARQDDLEQGERDERAAPKDYRLPEEVSESAAGRLLERGGHAYRECPLM